MLAERNEIRGLAPFGRFVCAAGGDHRPDNRGQERARVLPPDQIETLEGLVDEVQGMSPVGKHTVSLRRE